MQTKKNFTRAIQAANRLMLGGALFMPFATIAQAVESENLDSSERKLLEEIIVTARFRDESIQDMGMSMSALSGKEMERQGIVNFKDLAIRTPGLNFSDRGPNRNNVSIRGLSNLISDSTFQRNNPLIGMFLDDVSVVTAFSTQRSFNLFDLERAEVVRGPQGTLYGEGAMGGAIRYVTASPNLEETLFKIKVSAAQTENGDGLNHRLDATANIPIVDNHSGIRITLFEQHNAGYIDFTGENAAVHLPGAVLDRVPKNGANDYDANGVRVVYLAQATEQLTLRALVNYEQSKAGAEGIATRGAADLTNTSDFYLGEQEDDVLIFGGRINYEMSSGVFSSITGYVDRQRLDLSQRDAYTVGRPAIGTNDIEEKSFSQEFRFVSNLDGPVNFLTGLYYKQTDTVSDIVLSTVLEPSFDFLDIDEDFEAEQIAVFGEVNYQLTDRLTSTVGLRYFREEVDATQTFHSVTGIPADTYSDTLVVEELLPKLLLEYSVQDNVLLYGSFSKGARNGALNPTSSLTFAKAFFGVDLPRTYEQDTAASYELGAKTDWLNGDLTANLAYYYVDWKDLQGLLAEENSGFRFLDNVGDATSSGVEVELSARLNEQWSVFVAGNLGEAELDDSYAFSATSTAEAGAQIPNTPDYTVSMGADFKYPIDDDIDVTFHVDYQRVGSQASTIKSTPAPDTYYEVDEFDKLNINVGLITDKWELLFNASNLLDEYVEVNRTSSGASGSPRGTGIGPGANFYINRPRTLGLSFTAKF